MKAAVEDALNQRPEVVGQAKRVRASELIYSSITGERLPSLVAQGDYGQIGNRWGNTLDTYNMALLLQIPIFDGGGNEKAGLPNPAANCVRKHFVSIPS
jgi:outer membrane protein